MFKDQGITSWSPTLCAQVCQHRQKSKNFRIGLHINKQAGVHVKSGVHPVCYLYRNVHRLVEMRAYHCKCWNNNQGRPVNSQYYRQRP
jgi:hypothetical protein